MTKKHKNLPSRHNSMKRKARLQSAKTWLARYPGKNMVKGYSSHFAVDKLCAVKELQMIGVSEEGRNKYADSDENFAFIAGYSPGGFPYGITWEEWAETEENKSGNRKIF